MANLVGCVACGNGVSRDATQCPKCGHPMPAKGISKPIGKYILAGIALVWVVSCTIKGSLDKAEQERVAAANAERATLQAKRDAGTAAKKCADDRETYTGKFKELWAGANYHEAVLAIGQCHKVLKDDELSKMVTLAEVKDYTTTANDARLEPNTRIVAISALQRHYPEQVGNLAAVLPKLQAKAAQAESEARRKAETQEKARRKKEGVAIGMTQGEVLQSSWGRPEHVNRSTYSWGTTEQWVYGSRSYLYFKNGILDSIQN